jgi:hypothetical protein
MADADNHSTLVNEKEFDAMIVRQLADTDIHPRDQLRLVFLASCQTAPRSDADAFKGFAPALVAAGLRKVRVDYAQEAPVSPGAQLFLLAMTLYELGIYEELGHPAGSEATEPDVAGWQASIVR